MSRPASNRIAVARKTGAWTVGRIESPNPFNTSNPFRRKVIGLILLATDWFGRWIDR